LSYYPKLREQIDIRYIDFPRPRKEIVELVGGEHQGCPNLILNSTNHKYVDTNQFKSFGDKLYTSAMNYNLFNQEINIYSFSAN
jgi:Protein of unknown function (DUF3088)